MKKRRQKDNHTDRQTQGKKTKEQNVRKKERQ